MPVSPRFMSSSSKPWMMHVSGVRTAAVSSVYHLLNKLLTASQPLVTACDVPNKPGVDRSAEAGMHVRVRKPPRRAFWVKTVLWVWFEVFVYALWGPLVTLVRARGVANPDNLPRLSGCGLYYPWRSAFRCECCLDEICLSARRPYALIRGTFNPLTAKLFNLNFHPLEVVSRWRDTQLQVSVNYSDSTKWRPTLFKSCCSMSHFIFNMFKRWYLCTNKKMKTRIYAAPAVKGLSYLPWMKRKHAVNFLTNTGEGGKSQRGSRSNKTK